MEHLEALSERVLQLRREKARVCDELKLATQELVEAMREASLNRCTTKEGAIFQAKPASFSLKDLTSRQRLLDAGLPVEFFRLTIGKKCLNYINENRLMDEHLESLLEEASNSFSLFLVNREFLKCPN
jgi:vacuolar-type H+-ATPase subunit D/Vma8